MNLVRRRAAAACFAALACGMAAAQAQTGPAQPLQRFVIEREIAGASTLSPAQLREAAQRSNGVLGQLGKEIRWVHSYVAGDRIYCVYDARDEALIRRHAEQAGFPANRVTPLATMISPATAGPQP